MFGNCIEIASREPIDRVRSDLTHLLNCSTVIKLPPIPPLELRDFSNIDRIMPFLEQLIEHVPKSLYTKSSIFGVGIPEKNVTFAQWSDSLSIHLFNSSPFPLTFFHIYFILFCSCISVNCIEKFLFITVVKWMNEWINLKKRVQKI